MKNQVILQSKKKFSLRLFKKPWTLPRLLGVLGLIIFSLWFFLDVSFIMDTMLIIFVGLLLLIALIVVIKIKRKPIMAGILLLSVGWFYLFNSLVSIGGLNPILVLTGLFLILGGILAIKRAEKILEIEGKETPRHYRKIQALIVGLCAVLFLVFIMVLAISPSSHSRDYMRNTYRGIDMQQFHIAQEMYYTDMEDEQYFTVSGSVAGTPAIPGYLDVLHDKKIGHSDYVWLDNRNCEPQGQFFCVYATLEKNPLTYYAASEKGNKELDFIPGSIGGVYGIDHCNCWIIEK